MHKHISRLVSRRTSSASLPGVWRPLANCLPPSIDYLCSMLRQAWRDIAEENNLCELTAKPVGQWRLICGFVDCPLACPLKITAHNYLQCIWWPLPAANDRNETVPLKTSSVKTLRGVARRRGRMALVNNVAWHTVWPSSSPQFPSKTLIPS